MKRPRSMSENTQPTNRDILDLAAEIGEEDPTLTSDQAFEKARQQLIPTIIQASPKGSTQPVRQNQEGRRIRYKNYLYRLSRKSHQRRS
jgi:hypothetical protein